MINKNEDIWNKYQEKKKAIQEQLSHLGKPLEQIEWHSIRPVLNESAGECWLFHGTNHAQSILKNGFTTQYAQPEYFSGYGALGKGIYLTDLFSKAAIYINCSKCKQNHCTCSSNTPVNDRLKVVIVCRVILGKVKVVPLNSFRSKYRQSESPPDGFNSIWAPDKAFDLLDSGFDANEFCVPEDQVYPEICIFYVDNSFDSKENSSLFINKRMWEENYKSNFKSAKNLLALELEHSIYDYEGLSCLENQETKQLVLLTNRIKPLLVDMRLDAEKRKNKTELFYLNEIDSKWTEEFKRLQQNRQNFDPDSEHFLKLQFESKIWTYFEKRSFPDTIQTIVNMFKYGLNSSFTDYLLFLKALANFELNQLDSYVSLMNEALTFDDNNKSQIFKVNFDKEKQNYFETSLNCLFNSVEKHLNKSYFSVWLENVIEWLKSEIKDPLKTLETIYFGLKKYTDNNLDILENEIKKDKLPNKAGLRQITLELKSKCQKKLENQISCETRTSVGMSWLNDNGEIENRFLNAEIVEKIFNTDGIPLINSNDLSQRNGKKHVVLINKINKHSLVWPF